MILYRARPLSQRPSRLPAFEGNEPQIRIRGRWFTSVMADAIVHGVRTYAPGKWELISIEVADDIVDSMCVATTPHTRDGLSPIDYADKPETEYVVQTFRVMDAVQIELPSAQRGRVRDYIDVNAPRTAAAIRAATTLGHPIVDLPLAA